MADILQKQRFAIQARTLSEDPAFRRAYAKLYHEAFDTIRHSEPLEELKREEAYWVLRTLERLDTTIQAEIKEYDRAEAREERRQ